MSESKLKPIPIKDFHFVGLTQRKPSIPGGFFPPNNTKVTFQMPRKLPKHKKLVDYRAKAKKDSSFVRDEYKISALLSDNRRVPPLVFHNIKLYTNQQRSDRVVFISPSPKSCPLTSLRLYNRERPRTSMISSRKIGTDEHFASNPQLIRAPEKRKTEKINVFIKSPTLDLSNSDCSLYETNY